MADTRRPWVGILALLNNPTQDHHHLVAEDHQVVETGTMPIPLLAYSARGKAVRFAPDIVGTVNWVVRDGNRVLGAGLVDLEGLRHCLPATELGMGGAQPAAIDVRWSAPDTLEYDANGNLIMRYPWHIDAVHLHNEAAEVAWVQAHIRLAVPVIDYARPRRWV